MSAQSSSTDQVWDQLQDARTTVWKDGFKQLNYLIAWLPKGTSPLVNWPLTLSAGSSYMIVGVCDNDCADVDLALEDKNGGVIASDKTRLYSQSVADNREWLIERHGHRTPAAVRRQLLQAA